MESIIWISFIDGNKRNATVDLEDPYIPLSCRYFLIRQTAIASFEITDVYQISEDFQKTYTRFGVWENGVLTCFEGDFFARRMDFRGQKIKVAVTVVSY